MKVNIIGSGFAGLSAASWVAKAGHEVQVFEKNATIGGRARKFVHEGFVFDMGPSWYWMPDIFEKYFNHFGHSTHDFVELIKLAPAFKVFFENEEISIPNERESLLALFEKIEKGGGKKLDAFLQDGEYKYKIGVQDIIYRQPNGIMPFLDWKIIKSASKLQMFSSISTLVRKYFKDEKLIKILEFPVLFLGADPKKTPALYSLMAYAGLSLGTWYPLGGFHKIVDAMTQIAENLGVQFHCNQEITHIEIEKNLAKSIQNGSLFHKNEALIITADYHHFDSQVLPKAFRQYSQNYWETRTMAPSSLLFYIGYKGKIDNLSHHNLFFDSDFQAHTDALYKSKKFPKDPLFYVCCPSQTDSTVAPEGHENLFVLIPIATGLVENEEIKKKYFEIVVKRIQNKTGVDIRKNMVFKKDYATSDFIKDYHAYKGNAYGLANTLNQTAFLKPRMKHKKLKNVFFAGQLTVPGPGVPPAIISGELAAHYVNNFHG